MNSTPEPVVKDFHALRSFQFSDDHGVLHGYFYPQIVLDGINAAVCGLFDTHKAPVENCSCGFYAYDQTFAVPDRDVQGDIQAVVRLSGKIIPCERGVKAARMEIVALSWPTATPQQVAAVQRNYPAVVWCETVEDMCARFPLADFSREVEKPVPSRLSAAAAWVCHGMGLLVGDPVAVMGMLMVALVTVKIGLSVLFPSHGDVLFVLGVVQLIGMAGMMLVMLVMLGRSVVVWWSLWRLLRELRRGDLDSAAARVGGDFAVVCRNLSYRITTGTPRVLLSARMARVGVVPAGVSVMDVSDVERG